MADDARIAKDGIKKLANSFSNTPANVLDKKSEEQIKFQFIEPLLEALGWQKEDIEKEQRVLKGRADYILKIGNQEVMVIEAKRTSVPLDEDEGRQAVSYAYHRKIKFAVLTNFKQIRVYHALSNIKNINKNLLRDDKGYLVLNSYDFVNEFDRLRILSRESFEKGTINKLLSAKDEKVSKPIDESILEDLLQFRDWLSKDLKKLRMHLSDDAIDEIVQILIDRLIFMRSVEDRGLEEKGLLLNILKDAEQGRTEKVLWGVLKDQFRAFDKTYNSKLFSEGLLEKEGFFDEDTLKKVIKGLYFGTKDNRERYMFDEIPGDLLGDIYEQYLGTVLRGSDKRVKLEEGTGKRKKMGIYYTPSYIVDYIVKNTVGEYIRNKTIDEILDTRIVDPACGSGSFLIRAFREVCDVVEAKLKKGERSLKWLVFKNYNGRLSLGQKIQLLTNCIYGVDLDEKAVELAQLNLLLRLLEDETRETRKQLPPLKDNIKCGNSLIDDLSVSDKAFNWRAQFPKVFAQGGFDVVVGNPPWVSFGLRDVGKLDKKESDFYRQHYSSAEYKLSTYALFLECGINVLKDQGWLSFILPDSFLIGRYFSKTRRYTLNNCQLKKILLTYYDVFSSSATTGRNAIIVLKRQQLSNERIKNMTNVIKADSETNFISAKFEKFSYPQEYFENVIYNRFRLFFSKNEKELIENIEKNSELLCKYMTGHTGVRALIGQKNIISKDEKGETWKRGLISGSEIGKYWISYAGNYINIDPKLLNKGGWDPKVILNDKIMIRQTGDRLYAIIDANKYYHLNNIHSFDPKNKILDMRYILALLNSKMMSAYYLLITLEKNRVMAQTDIETLEKLPIKEIPFEKQQPLISLADKMLALQKKYQDGKIAGREKEQLEQQIKQVDWEIDQEVYKIYGITEEEKRVVEGSLK